MANLSRVFISYSRESDEHIERVRRFANRLRQRGIKVVLDQDCDSPSEPWQHWMDNQILKSEFIIMVCTAAYSRALTGNEEPGQRRGVVWEGRLIYLKKYYEDQYRHHKFICVFFRTNDEEHVPLRFKGDTFYNLADDDKFEELCTRLGGYVTQDTSERYNIPCVNLIGKNDEVKKKF